MFMHAQLPSLILTLLVFWPRCSYGGQDLQVRFDTSLKNARSITNVEIEFLDTLSIQDPTVLKVLNVNQPEFSRTFQYSFIASGKKYHAVSKLISGTVTNLVKMSESTFDGKSYSTFRGDTRYMTKNSLDAPVEGLSPKNPLIAPFEFLTKPYNGRLHVLRFTDITSEEFTQELTLPPAVKTNGVLRITISGLPFQGQTNSWKIIIDEAGDSYTPKSIDQISPTSRTEIVSRFLNYTNLGAYQFPSRIEWAETSYPPTSPPTLRSSGTVTLIAARIPDQIADSAFELNSEEGSAVRIWDWAQKNFTKLPYENTKSKAGIQSRPNIYDESADGSKQIADALGSATKEHKHVLLQFGANWCGWCHKLHNLFETDKSIAEILKSDYVVVMIDVNKGHNDVTDTKYGHPTRFGLPAIVVLDADGKQLTTQDTGKLEDGDHHSPDKVMAFLKEWAAKK
jgi:thiol-disulfide isomerase/thioredoxin